MTNTTSTTIDDTTPAFPEGHFTSVGIPLTGGFFLSRCKCGKERLTTTVNEGWAWSSDHQQEAWDAEEQTSLLDLEAKELGWSPFD